MVEIGLTESETGTLGRLGTPETGMRLENEFTPPEDYILAE